jgi:glutathione synthase/RimK-type ligase-like ATP-grasp enzyme
MPGRDGGTCLLKLSDGTKLQLQTLRSIWWRRVGNYRIDPRVTDPNIRRFCFNECEALFRGMLSSLSVHMVNRVDAEKSANHKLTQLSLAATLGLRVPKTIMSNDADEVRAFWEETGPRCIYKAFTPPTWRMAETRTLTSDDLEDFDKIRHAPIIVQEMIEKKKDVRVNIFGNRVFAAEVTTTHPEATLDWRLDLAATWSQHALPDSLSKKLIQFLRMLGLHYGCFDLRQEPSGEYVFLEVNPSGQFLFVEVDTGQPLLRAMAELLLSPSSFDISDSTPTDQQEDQSHRVSIAIA